MTKRIRTLGRFPLLLVPALVYAACTNLDEHPTSSITPGNYYRNEAEVLGALAGVYAVLRGTTNDYWNVTEVGSDEIIVPTRGSDWYDNGRWLEIHRQAWTPTSPSGLSDINGVWNSSFSGIARANALLDALKGVSVAGQTTIIAELRVLRAYFYYQLMDFFGGVPIATSSVVQPRARATRDSVFNFIVAELTAARPDLPAQWPSVGRGRVTKGAVDAILGNMYLNAGVFTKDNGINATGYNSCMTVQFGGQNACQLAVATADNVLNSGYYRLEDSFPKPFRDDNHQSPENIFVVKYIHQDGLGLNFIMRSLHYSQFTPSPWNGFATLAETYNAFDAADARRNIWLVGPQKNVLTGQPVTDRSGNPLVFTPVIRDATQATEGEGVRPYKWPADPQHVGPDNGNDFAIFRLGEIYLIKAEALNEISPGSGQALALLNALRTRDFNPPKPLAAVNRATILNERLFELTVEAKRRQDLIRFGQYTLAWGFKAATGPNVVLMPIPQPQLDANPLLSQNPGY